MLVHTSNIVDKEHFWYVPKLQNSLNSSGAVTYQNGNCEVKDNTEGYAYIYFLQLKPC